MQFEALRLEAPRAQLTSKPHDAIEVLFHLVEIAQFIAGKNAHGLAQHFRTRPPDERRGTNLGFTVFLRLAASLRKKRLNPTWSGRHFDAAEAVLAAEHHAIAEMFERRSHPALGVGRVREAAERESLRFGGT